MNQTFEDSKEQNRMVLESVGGIIQSGLWGHGVKIALVVLKMMVRLSKQLI